MLRSVTARSVVSLVFASFALVVAACSSAEGASSESCGIDSYTNHCEGDVLVACAAAEDCSHHEDCGFIGCSPCVDYPHVYGTDCRKEGEICVEVVDGSGDRIGARCQ